MLRGPHCKSRMFPDVLAVWMISGLGFMCVINLGLCTQVCEAPESTLIRSKLGEFEMRCVRAAALARIARAAVTGETESEYLE